MIQGIIIGLVVGLLITVVASILLILAIPPMMAIGTVLMERFGTGLYDDYIDWWLEWELSHKR